MIRGSWIKRLQPFQVRETGLYEIWPRLPSAAAAKTSSLSGPDDIGAGAADCKPPPSRLPRLYHPLHEVPSSVIPFRAPSEPLANTSMRFPRQATALG